MRAFPRFPDMQKSSLEFAAQPIATGAMLQVKFTASKSPFREREIIVLFESEDFQKDYAGKLCNIDQKELTHDGHRLQHTW